ncbi:MAG: class I SAM-dependent methyltransferase [Armatimonadota bacterium]
MVKWDPVDYNKSSSAQLKWAMELINVLKLYGNERILDIGCGDGKVTSEIAHQMPNGSVLGIDQSNEMISFARDTYLPNEIQNLDFRVMDASNLVFNEEFDLIVSFACLHWITDHQPVVDGIKRSLKPNGRVLIQCGGKGNAADIIKVINEVITQSEWNQYFMNFIFPYGFYGPDEYVIMLKDAGLLPLRVELISKDMTQIGRDGLMSWIRTTWMPYLECIPNTKRNNFIEEITDRYLTEHPLDEAGITHLTMKRLEIEAINNCI